jgi:UDP-3-O-[3-hydroxymyristoyl] glucosamine N-acyltransferase
MQSTIKVTLDSLKKHEGPFLKFRAGHQDCVASSATSPEHISSPDSLVFVSKKEFLTLSLEKAKILILEEPLFTESLCTQLRADQALFTTPSLKAAMVLVLPLFDKRNLIQDALISQQAFVHPTAIIENHTRVAPGASIGAHVKIGAHCHIHSNVVIEAFCEIGDHCEIHSGTVIGSDGFGYATHPVTKDHHKVPQIGNVIIEDHVEIGANCAIDRATLHSTIIRKGTKIDNLVHVAHNCELGAQGLYAAGFMTAGSTKVGARFMCGGDVVLADHITLCDNVTLGARSAVSKSITEPGAYTGYPVEPLKDGLRTIQNLTNLTKMRKELAEIRKKLEL